LVRKEESTFNLIGTHLAREVQLGWFGYLIADDDLRIVNWLAHLT
jgi:hypothetical protein